MTKLKKAKAEKKKTTKKPAKEKKKTKPVKRAGATAKPAKKIQKTVGKLDNTVAFNVSLPEGMLKKLDKRVAVAAKKAGTKISRSAFVRDTISGIL